MGHNFGFDLNWLREFGLNFEHKPVFCTQVAEYTLRNYQKLASLKLNTLCTHYGITNKLDKVAEYWDSGFETNEIPAEILCPYGEQDCASTLNIYFKQIELLVKRNQLKLVSIEMEVIKHLSIAEFNGMLLDIPLLQQYTEQYDIKIDKLDASMKLLIPDNINLDSGEHLSAALYGGMYQVDGVEDTFRTLKSGEVKAGTRKCKLKHTTPGLGITPLPKTNLKKEGYWKTSAEIMGQLKSTTKSGKEFLKLYKERAKLATLNKTFFKGLLQRVEESGTVHPSINQTITRTSRLSCSNPNLQNQPRGNTGPVKGCFISRY